MAKLKVQSDIRPFTMIKNAIIDSENILNDHEKLLYIVLLRYGDKAFPSLATLSKKCGFSKSTAQRTIDTLIKKGLLKKRNRVNKKNGNTSNEYILIDNDKIWFSAKENLQENINAAILEEAIKIVEASGRKVSDKEKEPVSAPTKVTETSPNQSETYDNSTLLSHICQDPAFAKERYTREQIINYFEFDILLHDHPDDADLIDAAIDTLYDVLSTDRSTIKINGQDKPASAVIGRLMKLNKDSIMFTIKKVAEQKNTIKNLKQYLITALYSAPAEYALHIQNMYSTNT